MQPFAASGEPGGTGLLHESEHHKQFAGDVEYYLALKPRQLPSRYLYDPLGSALFNAICELPWYRITRAEVGLLAAHGREILAHAGLPRRQARLVELGPGDGTKLRTLLEASRGDATNRGGRDALHDGHLELHLIDVSATALEQASSALGTVDDVEVVAHRATYEGGLREIAGTVGRTLVLFLGSNIGNFDRPATDAFLRSVRGALASGDHLLIGADLVKPEKELLLAYDDPLGVTAAFNRNLLVRINRELGGDFDVEGFAHRARWNRRESRVEMHLVSRRRQPLRIPSAHIDIVMKKGETIWTESSYKYDPDELAAILARAGFRSIERWMASEERFLLTLARAE
jgi:dimethylhistidine N-methyltransferase